MTTRDRNRYLLCEVVQEKTGTGSLRQDHLIGAFRQSVQNNSGDLGMATYGSASKIVISFAETCGLFIIRVPMAAQAECLQALSTIISVGLRTAAVRVLHISGRLKNTVMVASERILAWRNSLPQDFAVPRKELLGAQVRQMLTALHSLPPYV
jgi:RNase P/RNase MRP subunit POP5